MRKTISIYGSLALALILLFRIGRYAVFSGDMKTEVLLAVTASVFLGVGLLVRQREKVATVTAPPQEEGTYLVDWKVHGLTEREYEVLGLIAEGHSNREIGERLFLSESTIKTHVSNLLSKLDARRRTQAVERARSLKII